jgi:hypothetical protein
VGLIDYMATMDIPDTGHAVEQMDPDVEFLLSVSPGAVRSTNLPPVVAKHDNEKAREPNTRAQIGVRRRHSSCTWSCGAACVERTTELREFWVSTISTAAVPFSSSAPTSGTRDRARAVGRLPRKTQDIPRTRAQCMEKMQ